MRSTKPQFHANEEDFIELAEVLNKTESLTHEAISLAFVSSTKDQDLFAQVAIPLDNIDTKILGAQDHQIKEVILGRPTLDTTILMVTMGIKGVFRNMEQEETKLHTL